MRDRRAKVIGLKVKTRTGKPGLCGTRPMRPRASEAWIVSDPRNEGVAVPAHQDLGKFPELNEFRIGRSRNYCAVSNFVSSTNKVVKSAKFDCLEARRVPKSDGSSIQLNDFGIDIGKGHDEVVCVNGAVNGVGVPTIEFFQKVAQSRKMAAFGPLFPVAWWLCGELCDKTLVEGCSYQPDRSLRCAHCAGVHCGVPQQAKRN